MDEKKRAMPKLLTACMIVCIGVSAEGAVLPGQDCGELFISKVTELLEIKQSCRSAFYENCCQIKQLVSRAASGVYNVRYLAERSPFNPYSYTHIEALCDMETDGGGWLVIQRRLPNGTVDFTRDWADYENGFGHLNGEFWYGLRNIHALTTQNEVELRIDMVRESDDFELHWTYQNFSVAGVSDMYRLTIGEAEGSYGTDAMAYHDNQKFSTYDNDNDQDSKSCSFLHQGGWWYSHCYRANLNGPHTLPAIPGIHTTYARLIWYDGTNFIDLSSAEMKIRVKQCHLAAEGTSC